jgi:hypothetical protein
VKAIIKRIEIAGTVSATGESEPVSVDGGTVDLAMAANKSGVSVGGAR